MYIFFNGVGPMLYRIDILTCNTDVVYVHQFSLLASQRLCVTSAEGKHKLKIMLSFSIIFVVYVKVCLHKVGRRQIIVNIKTFNLEISCHFLFFSTFFYIFQGTSAQLRLLNRSCNAFLSLSSQNLSHNVRLTRF